jgi:Epoxide hydrolase N terminus
VSRGSRARISATCEACWGTGPTASTGAQERWLNGFRHFRAEIDGIRVHFVHERARSGRGIPLVLTNGWPSCFAEFLPLVPRLTDPAAHGIEGPGFDVVIPSLPGYGFRTGRPGPA